MFRRSGANSNNVLRNNPAMEWTVTPIGIVSASRAHPEDDNWGAEESSIVLADGLPDEALDGIDTFSHVEILFVLHDAAAAQIVTGARHPRNNVAWPKVGIFAQRGKNRPNRIGSTICRVVRRDARRLDVAELDAIDGTPVLDIKPVMQEFLPREPVSQPQWSHELMAAYWQRRHPTNR